jgi:rhodanese-related sulfurtransferase
VLAARLANGEALVLLDVREPVERSFCKIAVDRPVVDLHVPVGRVTEDVEAIRSASTGVPVVVYCHHGVRSRMVADWLLLQGLNDLSNLSGGIDAWSLVVDPQVARY